MFSLAIAEKIALPMRVGSTIGYVVHFGAAQVFMDVDDIPPGEDFVAHIERSGRFCWLGNIGGAEPVS